MDAFKPSVLPRHMGIILDGNGRWATQRGLKRTQGHIAGSENVISITRECSNLGIEVLSLYAFSTENWKRSVEEVSALMNLLVKFISKYLDELDKNNVRLMIMGDPSRLPFASRKACEMAVNRTKKNQGMILNIGLNYGGRDEIVRAIQRWMKENPKSECTEEEISRHLDTASFPDLDLIVRTGGEIRLSNFMIWQAAYAEFIFTDCLWPDYSIEELHKSLEIFSQRQRRFGGVS